MKTFPNWVIIAEKIVALILILMEKLILMALGQAIYLHLGIDLREVFVMVNYQEHTLLNQRLPCQNNNVQEQLQALKSLIDTINQLVNFTF